MIFRLLLIWQILTAKKYAHSKTGNIYYRLFECVGTEDQVIYTLYCRANRLWARPKEMFEEKFKDVRDQPGRLL